MLLCFKMHNGKFAMICKFKYAEICTKYATICSTKFARNMCKYANKKYAIHVHNKPKYAQMCKTKICSLSAHICKHTICINMQKMHKICKTKYAQTCIFKICKNMHCIVNICMIFLDMHQFLCSIQVHVQKISVTAQTFATIKLLDPRVAAQAYYAQASRYRGTSQQYTELQVQSSSSADTEKAAEIYQQNILCECPLVTAARPAEAVTAVTAACGIA